MNPMQLKITCRSCHPVECGQTGYLSLLPSLQIRSHKKQNFSRDYSRFDCIGCHQGKAAHGEEEIINQQDCHKCHQSAPGKSSLMGYIHPQADSRNQPGIFADCESVKEIAQMDGAFIISADGCVMAGGRILDAPAEELTLSKGLGSRHWAAAAISKATNAVAIAVSESSGTVRLFQNGMVVLRIEPMDQAMKWFDVDTEPPASE